MRIKLFHRILAYFIWIVGLGFFGYMGHYGTLKPSQIAASDWHQLGFFLYLAGLFLWARQVLKSGLAWALVVGFASGVVLLCLHYLFWGWLGPMPESAPARNPAFWTGLSMGLLGMLQAAWAEGLYRAKGWLLRRLFRK